MTRPPVPQLVRRALARHALADTPDADLLARFRARRDEAAFTELVERHAPLVWGACRRVLGTGPRAEDAFQVTFVTLARKAGSLRAPERLSGWLYGVARRVAWQHRDAGRVTQGDCPDRASPATSPLDQVSGRELLEAIEGEVDRLPEAYRSAVLLCWFQDCTVTEAARQLGATPGGVAGRLKRARERLRRRLAARGYGLPAVFGAALFGTAPASAALTGRTVTAALERTTVSAVGTAAMVLGMKPVCAAVLAAATLVGVGILLPAGDAGGPAKDAAKADPKPTATPFPDGIPLPAGAVHRFGNRQLRHPAGISGVVASPDGKWLATTGYQSVIVWDVRTLAVRQLFQDPRLAVHGSEVGAGRVSFLPDGTGLVVAMRPDGASLGEAGRNPVVDVALVLDLDTGKPRYAVKGGADFEPAAWVSAGGKELVTVADGKARFHDLKSGKELRAVGVPTATNVRPWVAPAADRIAVQSIIAGQPGLSVMDVRAQKTVATLPDDQVIQAAFRADGKVLAVHARDGKVRLHDLEAGKELLAFDHPAKTQMGPMQFGADGKTLYFGGQYGQLYRWDVAANRRLPDPGRHSTWTLSGLALSPDEVTLYSVGFNLVVHRWDLKAGKQLPLPEGYTTQTAVVPMPDGKHLLVADHAGRVDLWDLACGKAGRQIQPGGTGGLDCVDVSADGRWFAGGRTTQDVRLWDLSTGRVVRDIPLVTKPDNKGGDHVRRVAFRPDGKVLLAGSFKTGVTAWEVPTGKKLWNATGVPPLAVWDPKGRFIVTAGGFGERDVFWVVLDPTTGAVIRRVEVERLPPTIQGGDDSYLPHPTGLAFTPDGSRLVTGQYDGTIRVWDPETGRDLRRFTGNPPGPLAVAVSPDGRWLGVGCQDFTVAVWELASGQRVLSRPGHLSLVRDVAFTRDGRGLIGNADVSPVLWSLEPKDVPALNTSTDALWAGLAGADAAKAYRLLWALAKDPAAAVRVLTGRLDPAEQALDKARFDQLVADLDSPRFAVREKAEKELATAGHRVPAAWLGAAGDGAKSDELRTRLDRVLAGRAKPSSDELRLIRAVTVLELAGTAEAKDLLKAWAAAPAGSLLAVEATAALGRLTGR